jgi:hypothetical protein
VAEIARRARGTPRIANRLLRRVRDYAQVRGDGRATAESTRLGGTGDDRGRARALPDSDRFSRPDGPGKSGDGAGLPPPRDHPPRSRPAPTPTPLDGTDRPVVSRLFRLCS